MTPDQARWHRLTTLVGYFALTGRVPPYKPQSLLLIGPPGVGKTALLERFRPVNGESYNTSMAFASNLTGMGLQTILRDQVRRGVSHVVAPEFQTFLLKRAGVWETLLGLMLPAMDEGVDETYVGPKRQAYHHAKCGMIAAMPTDAYNDYESMMADTGLKSRFQVIKLERSPEDVLAARQRANLGDLSDLMPVVLDAPAKIEVGMSTDVRLAVTEYAATLDAQNVNREANRLLALVQVIAYCHHARTVQLNHLYDLVDYADLWAKM